jgi:hypothetical protein
MKQLAAFVSFAVSAAGLFGIGTWCLFFPRRLQALNIIRLRKGKIWWPWSALLADRFRSRSYLWEVRICGAAALLMGILFGIAAVWLATGRMKV